MIDGQPDEQYRNEEFKQLMHDLKSAMHFGYFYEDEEGEEYPYKRMSEMQIIALTEWVIQHGINYKKLYEKSHAYEQWLKDQNAPPLTDGELNHALSLIKSNG